MSLNQEIGNKESELKEGVSKIKNYFKKVFDLSDGVDKRAVIEEISEKKSMSGANSWMLMCSIVIASIGLDIDSPVILIGAMLISPLMSPILGIGLGVAINDIDMLKDSIFQFSIATGIAIVISTIYFGITPFGEMNEQITLRTEPTFLDIPIAFFGGIAGIVSIARKDILTALPGVAIATALMPPLCVVGYGISCGEWEIVASSFYLFLLNIFFVSLATFLIIRYLKFPFKQYIDDKERRKNAAYAVLFTIIIMIPSIFIFFSVYDRFNTTLKLEQFIDEYIADDKIYLDDYQIINSEGHDKLVLKVYGDKINKTAIPYLEKGLAAKGLKDIDIAILSTADINLDRMQELEKNVAGVDSLESKLMAIVDQQEALKENQINYDKLPTYMTMDSLEQVRSVELMKTAFPTIDRINLSYGIQSDSLNKSEKSHFAFVDWTKKPTVEEKERLATFLEKQFDLKNIILRE